MRPQLDTNYRHLCSPSTPVTAELFGEDLPMTWLYKDISDINCLSAKLTKNGSSNRVSKSSQRQTFLRGKSKYGGFHKNSNNKQSKKVQRPLHFRRKQEEKKKID